MVNDSATYLKRSRKGCGNIIFFVVVRIPHE